MMVGASRDGEPAEPIRAWLATDHRTAGTLRRLDLVEELLSYWVPISTERDLRLDVIEQRLAALEQDDIPESYSGVADLADQVAMLEATVWEVRRRLSNLAQ
jgi:hypothetical protein